MVFYVCVFVSMITGSLAESCKVKEISLLQVLNVSALYLVKCCCMSLLCHIPTSNKSSSWCAEMLAIALIIKM